MALWSAEQRENISHKKIHGTWQSAEKHPRALISNDMARLIKKDLHEAPKSETGRLKRGEGKRLQDKYGISINVIYKINQEGYADAWTIDGV